MDNPVKSKIDFSKKEAYLKEFTRRHYTRMVIAMGFPLIFIIIISFYAKEKYQIGIMFFPFLLLSSTIFFSKCRQQLFLTHYLKSEFVLTPESLTLYINGRKRKQIKFQSTITLKTVPLGTYVLNGNFGWADFNLSKRPPTRMPTRIDDIFIPSIAENYSALVKGINEYKLK